MAASGNRHLYDLVSLLIRRDLKIRYRDSALGYLWSMMNPLLMMTVLTIVFSQAMRIEVPHYPVYVLSGLLCWTLFASSSLNGVHAIVGNASLLKKVKVPSWVFPTATIGSACVHMGLALIPFLVIAFATGLGLHVQLVQLPLVVAVYFLFIEGVVLIIGTLNVFFRDVGHVMEPVLQLVFYSSPILYPAAVVPEKFQLLIKLNPIYHYAAGFRAALYSGEWLGLTQWAAMLGFAAAALALGFYTYSRLEDRFLYHI